MDIKINLASLQDVIGVKTGNISNGLLTIQAIIQIASDENNNIYLTQEGVDKAKLTYDKENDLLVKTDI